MAAERLSIVVGKGGETRFVYNEVLDLSSLGTQVIKRASHVEPTRGLSSQACLKILGKWARGVSDAVKGIALGRWPTSWWSDLTPVGGPVLGPFAKRSQALEAETAWLQRNVILAGREKKETV